MRFVVSIGSDTHQVDVVSRDGDALAILVDGIAYDLNVAGPLYAPPQRTASATTQVSPVIAVSKQEAPTAGLPHGHLAAPIPGLIAEVKVTPGMSVQAGSVVVVIEAMKMENNISAPTSGVVRKVQVAKGQEVQRGQLLVVIDPG